MSWTTPRTWTPGELVTAVMMNQHVKDQLNFLKTYTDAAASAGHPGGRLTLETGVPVSTTDQSAKTTLYYTPYLHNQIWLMVSSVLTPHTFAELSISLAGKTASTPYDVFCYSSAGAATLELLAWTNGTTRATALARTGGILFKSGDTTRRYLGTIYINSSGGQCEDTATKRFVWNFDNRLPRQLKRSETTQSWTYTLTTWRNGNNTTANRVEVVVGVVEDALSMRLDGGCINTAGNTWVALGVGVGGADPSTAQAGGAAFINAANTWVPLHASFTEMPTAGYSVYQWMEASQANGVTTWWALNGAIGKTAGISGSIRA